MNELTNLFFNLYDKVEEIHRERCKNEIPLFRDLSYEDEYYLDVLFRLQITTLSEYAKTVSLSKPGVTKLFRRLEKKGFVLREQSQEDKRIYYVSLTTEVKESFEQFYKHFDDLFSQMQDILTESEVSGLKKSLKKLNDNMHLINEEKI